jgi:hypothetical protein
MQSKQDNGLYEVEVEHNWVSGNKVKVARVLVQWKGTGYAHSRMWSWTDVSNVMSRTAAEKALVEDVLRSRGKELVKLWMQESNASLQTAESGIYMCPTNFVGSFSNSRNSCWAVQFLSVVAYSAAGPSCLSKVLGPQGHSEFGSLVAKTLSSIPSSFWRGLPPPAVCKEATKQLHTFMDECESLKLNLGPAAYHQGACCGFDDAWSQYIFSRNSAEVWACSTCVQTRKEGCNQLSCSYDTSSASTRWSRKSMFTLKFEAGSDIIARIQNELTSPLPPVMCSTCGALSIAQQITARLFPSMLRVSVPVQQIGAPDAACRILGTRLVLQHILPSQSDSMGPQTHHGWSAVDVHYTLRSIVFYGNVGDSAAPVRHYWGAHRTNASQWVLSDDVACAATGSLVHEGLVTAASLDDKHIMNATMGGSYANVQLLEIAKGTEVSIVTNPSRCPKHSQPEQCTRAQCPYSYLAEVQTVDCPPRSGHVMAEALLDLRPLLARFSVDPLHDAVSGIHLVFESAPLNPSPIATAEAMSAAWVEGLTAVAPASATTNSLAPSTTTYDLYPVAGRPEVASEEELPCSLFDMQASSSWYQLAPTSHDPDNTAQKTQQPWFRQDWVQSGHLLMPAVDASLVKQDIGKSQWVAAIGEECVLATILQAELEAFHGVGKEALMLKGLHVFQFNVPSGPFKELVCFAIVQLSLLCKLGAADWQCLWLGSGMRGDLCLGRHGLCVALYSCPSPLKQHML